MTIEEALKFGAEKLRKEHTHDSEGCARFLLRHALAKALSSKYQEAVSFETLLLTEPDLMLNTECLSLYREMLQRRALHEPVWYITNEAYFWKDTFYVDERVLIPRPETELVVEKVLEYIKSAPANKLYSVIDVGTGSGVIAISLYKELVQLTRLGFVTMYATDTSPEAIEVAKENAKRLGVGKGIEFLVGDALEPLQSKVDIIVGNPPYVPSEVVGGLAYDIHHFEPRIALDGGKDGLEVHRKILSQSVSLLKSGGSIFMEIGHDQGHALKEISKTYFPKAKADILKDYEGHDRILSIKHEGGAF